MRPGTAEVEIRDRHPVIGVAEHGSRGKQLVECEGAMEDVATDEAEFALEVER